MSSIIRRNIKSRIKIFITAVAIASIMAIIISSNILIAKAGVRDTDGADDTLTKKYYSSMTVRADDTLWDLSERFRGEETNKEYIENIMKMNDMSDDTIYSGMQLAYYYYTEI